MINDNHAARCCKQEENEMIRAVLIDPYAETASERVRVVSIGGDHLKAYYDLIGHGCNLVEAVYPDALQGECIYVDEEGLWQQYAGFRIQGHHQALMGRGIVVGTDDEGNTISSLWNAHSLQARVAHWLMDFDRLAEDIQV
jgi:hypothetical protein